MEKCLKSSENRNERILRKASIVMLSLFAILAYLDVISVMVPFVLVSYGVMSVLSVAYIVFYFVVRKNSFSFDIPNVSFLCFAFFTILSMAVNKGSLDRDAVAIFNLLQIITVFISLKELNRQNYLVPLLKVLFIFIFIFVAIVLLVSKPLLNGYLNGGITPNINALGSLVSIGIIASFFIISFTEKKAVKCCIIILDIYLLYEEVLIGSRTAEISLLISIITFFALFLFIKCDSKIKRIIYFLSIFLLIVSCVIVIQFIVLSPKYEDSSALSGREEIWATSFKALEGNYILGFGGNTDLIEDAYSFCTDSNIIKYARNHLLHNIYIQILVEYGIFALAAFLVMVVSVLLKYLIYFFKTGSENNVGLINFALVIAFLLHGLAESSILYIGGPEQFTFVFALSLMYLNCKKESI